MIYSKKGVEVTKHFEQCRLNAYQDQGGVWTIAWGHTRGVGPGLTCMQVQADAWLDEDNLIASHYVNLLVKVTLTQGEFDALVDFVVNLGGHAFATSSLLKLLNEGKFTEAAAQFDKWDHVGAKEVAGLLRRREAETEEFEAQ